MNFFKNDPRGPDWPFDAERLREGDACEFRYPARKEWQPGTVVRNGGGYYWCVRAADGTLARGLYIEHVRTPQGSRPIA